MEFFAEAYGIADPVEKSGRIRELLEFFDLWERRGDKAGTFSKGMKQKLAIARALVHGPEVLFLDEPTSGLDPRSSKDIRDLMEELSRRERRTILLSTHRLEDAERLCDRVMIIREGASVVIGSPEELQRKIAGTPVLEIRLRGAPGRTADAIRALDGVIEVAVDAPASRLMVSLDDAEASTPEVVRAVVEVNGEILSVGVIEPSLEEAYLRLVGGEDG